MVISDHKEACVQSQDSQYGIYGAQSTTGTDFFSSARKFLNAYYHSTSAPYSVIIKGWYKNPFLSCAFSQHLSQDVLSVAEFLRDKVAMCKDTLYSRPQYKGLSLTTLPLPTGSMF